MNAEELKQLEAEEALAWEEVKRIRTEVLTGAEVKWCALYRQLNVEKIRFEIEQEVRKEMEAQCPTN